MFLLVLYVFDTPKIKECETLEEAQGVRDRWCAELKKAFPYKIFGYVIYAVESVAMRGQGGLINGDTIKWDSVEPTG